MKKGKPKAPAKSPRKKPKGQDKTAAVTEESPLGDAEARRRQVRVANLRDKIRTALDDPDKRQQLVDAIRTMMRGES